GHFASKPTGPFKSGAACGVWKFHFRHYQTMVATAIDVDFDLEIFPRNFVTDLAQSTTARRRPQHGELLGAQPDLAFFARSGGADLGRARSHFPAFSHATKP